MVVSLLSMTKQIRMLVSGRLLNAVSQNSMPLSVA